MTGIEQISAHRTVTKRLGNWTTARLLQVRAHRGVAVLDLRSADLRSESAEIRVEAELEHAVLTLLVADDAAIDDWDLHRTGRGRLKDSEAPQNAGQVPNGRRVVLTGRMHDSEIRVRRGGMAVLTAMFSREFLNDLRQSRAEGRMPTVADPAQGA